MNKTMNRWRLFRISFALVIWLAVMSAFGNVAKAEKPTPDSFKLVLVGDTGHGENYQAKRQSQGKPNVLEESGYDAPLSSLKPLLDGADYVVANLETPVIVPENAAVVPYPEKDYSHWTDPALALPALRKVGINAVSLANNHAVDYAEAGLIETLSHLDAANMKWFGAGRDLAEAQRPLSIPLPDTSPWSSVEVIGVFEYRSSYDTKYGFYANEQHGGTYAINADALRAQITQLKSREKPPLVIVYPHWGNNYVWRDDKQVELAKSIIDAGADLIVGHGAHMIQEVDKIEGRTVFYSLGNFMFLSDGRYTKLAAPPYSAVMWLEIPTSHQASELPALTARLYPILTDNLQTNFRSRPVTESEFHDFKTVFHERCSEGIAGQDQRGKYLSFSIKVAP